MESESIIRTTAFTLNKKATELVNVVQLYKQSDGKLVEHWDEIPDNFRTSLSYRTYKHNGHFLLFIDDALEQLKDYGFTFKDFAYDFDREINLQRQIALYLIQKRLTEKHAVVSIPDIYIVSSFHRATTTPSFIKGEKLTLHEHHLHPEYFSLNVVISNFEIPRSGKLKPRSLVLTQFPPDKPFYQIVRHNSPTYVQKGLSEKELFVKFNHQLRIPRYLSPVSPEQEKRVGIRDISLKQRMEREHPYYESFQDVFDFKSGKLHVINDFQAQYKDGSVNYPLFPDDAFDEVLYNHAGEVWRRIRKGHKLFYHTLPDFDIEEQRAILFTTTEAAKIFIQNVVNDGKRWFSSLSEIMTGKVGQLQLDIPKAPSGFSASKKEEVEKYFQWVRHTLQESNEDYRIVFFEVPERSSLKDEEKNSYADPYVVIKDFLHEKFPDLVSHAFYQSTVLAEDQKLLAAESATIVGQILNKLGAIPCVFDDIQLLGHDFKDWQVISIGQCTCKHYLKQDIFEGNTIEHLFTADAKSFFTLERGYFVGLHREFDYQTLIEYIEREQIIEFVAHLKQHLTGCDAYNAALPTLIVFDDLHRKRNDNGETPYSQISRIFAKAIREFNAPAIVALICKGDQVRLIGENSAVCRISKKGNYYVKHRKDLYSSFLQLPFGWSYLSTGETNPNIGPKTARPVPALVHFFHNTDSNSFNEQEVLEFLLKLCHLKSVASSRTALPFQLREARSMVEKGERS